MNIILRTLPAALLLVALAGCGSADDDAPDSVAQDSSTPSSSTDPSNPGGDAPAEDGDSSTVVSVSFHRSGGLKPLKVDRTFSTDEAPPEDYSRLDVEKVIASAQKLLDAGVTLPEMPKDTCCDRYTYLIIVGLADGSSTTYTSLDGLQQPPEFADLLSAVS